MAYVAPTVRSVGDAVTAADYNIMANDVIDLDSRVTQLKRIGFTTRTTSYSIPSTTVPGAADAFASDVTWTADGTSSYRIESYWPFIESAQTANAYVELWLVDGSGNKLGRLAYVGYGDGTRSAAQGAVNPSYFYTPTAGSTSINIRMVVNTGTGNATAGAGGATDNVPAYLAVNGPTLT